MPIAKTTTGVLRLATLAQDDGGLECSGSEYISRSFALLRISPAGSRCAHARKAAQLRMTAGNKQQQRQMQILRCAQNERVRGMGSWASHLRRCPTHRDSAAMNGAPKDKCRFLGSVSLRDTTLEMTQVLGKGREEDPSLRVG